MRIRRRPTRAARSGPRPRSRRRRSRRSARIPASGRSLPDRPGASTQLVLSTESPSAARRSPTSRRARVPIPRPWWRASTSSRQRYVVGWTSVRAASIKKPTSSPSASIARIHGTTGWPSTISGTSASVYDSGIGRDEPLLRVVGRQPSDRVDVVMRDLDEPHRSTAVALGRSRHASRSSTRIA